MRAADRIAALRAALADIAQYGTDPDGHPDRTIRAQEALRVDRAAERAAEPDLAVPPVYGIVSYAGRWTDLVRLVSRDGEDVPLWTLPRGIAGWVAERLGDRVARLVVDLGLAEDHHCGLRGVPAHVAAAVVTAAQVAGERGPTPRGPAADRSWLDEEAAPVTADVGQPVPAVVNASGEVAAEWAPAPPEAIEIRRRVDSVYPRTHPDGSINSGHVAAEQTLRTQAGLPGFIGALDGPGRFIR